MSSLAFSGAICQRFPAFIRLLREAPDAAHAAPRSFRNQLSQWQDLIHHQNNLLPVRPLLFPRQTTKLTR
ncbi:hypothetical protein CBM2633_A50128 [Cupriavidus taiwanensis]|uniref:Uncharacterized protein n=1 Tax=Cupriavidus taiwanensis TaxID=164546 RepID=A0A375DWR4_9BURK|nr:hypothetical protein CBM2615_A120100 [Cupriavidus taiwanensis]SOZ49261.1 hypothetical protein CBM2614_A120098 [Cupriavidus taiwanensis]SOZ51907.1 hypothetical protein CBM2613_A110099 [Cupriavidus taiwanensis]SPA00140.1 hypothetical protein CBM2626_A50355 [Cupriavidus taiwanensis]SPA07108.1 hypothetical protein CBM2625_A90097 [Cupriavidus taiwanensis]